MSTRFTYAASTVTIALDPVRPLSLPRSGAVPNGTDSAGNRYYYPRPAPPRDVTLVFPTVTQAELTALQNFMLNVVRGARLMFSWLDQDGASHGVRYRDLQWQRRGPDWYRVTVALTEAMS